MGKRGPIQPPRAERFWMRVNKTGDCWLWTGAINRRRGGYGYFYDDDTRLRRAHRVAWELTHGPLTEDEKLCHACDNPACVRPSHLFVGTQADNLRDMRAKGRGNGLLDSSKVQWLRREHAAGRSARELGTVLGVSESCADKAIRGVNWAHVS